MINENFAIETAAYQVLKILAIGTGFTFIMLGLALWIGMVLARRGDDSVAGHDYRADDEKPGGNF